jgi:hypothetical protein
MVNGNDPINERSIVDLARQIVQLNTQAVTIYKPIVESIVSSRSEDVRNIERTLDELLGLARSDEGLQLFKRLCRYYWTISPEATTFYVHAYRDMWDNDDPSTEAGAS